MKKLLGILAVAPLVLTACGSSRASTDTVKLMAPNGAPATAVVSMAAGEYKDQVDFIDGSPSLVGAFTNGTHNAIVAPVHFGKAGVDSVDLGYKLAGTVSQGGDYIISTDPNVTTAADIVAGDTLIGYGNCLFAKAVLGVAFAPGSTCTALASTNLVGAQYMIDQAEATPEETLYMVAETTLVNLEVGDNTLISLEDVWAEANDSMYPKAGVFLADDLIKENKAAAIQVLDDIEESIGVYKDDHDKFVQDAAAVNYAYDVRLQDKVNLNFQKAFDIKDEIKEWAGLINPAFVIEDDYYWNY